MTTELIWTQDEFLAAEVVDGFVAGASESDEVLTLSCDADVTGLEEALFASSLFAAKRYVVIWKAEALRKTGIERIADALSKDTAADVVVVATSEYQPSQLIKSLQGIATLKRLARPRRGQLVSWVAKRVKAAGLNADNDVPGTLVEAVGEGLRDLAQAVDQLALRLGPGARLSRKDVLEHFSVSAEQPIWALLDAIVRHEGPKAYDLLHRSLAQGDEPLAVLFGVVSQVRHLIRAKSVLERSPSMAEDALARALDVSPGRAAVLRRQVGRLSWEWLLGVHRLLADADFELKGGEDGAVLPAEIVLERVLAGALDAG